MFILLLFSTASRVVLGAVMFIKRSECTRGLALGLGHRLDKDIASLGLEFKRPPCAARRPPPAARYPLLGFPVAMEAIRQSSWQPQARL